MSNVKNLLGNTYCRLTVISFAFLNHRKVSFWKCQCSCGNHIVVSSSNLQSNHTKSCGCLKKEAKQNITHGNTSGITTKEYSSWCSMKNRCFNENVINYKDYGGRGITVCDRWLHVFTNFLEDMGRAPSSNHTIDRINNDGNYEPGNCRWATRKEQSNNRRTNILISYNNELKSLVDWCTSLGLYLPTIANRIRKLKWSPERAFTEPIKKIN